LKKNKKADKKPVNKSSQVNLWRFAVIYILMMGAFLFLIGFKPIQDVIDLNGIYTNFIVIMTAKILKTVNMSCTYQGSIISLPGIALDVKFGCNGLEAVMIYSVAVIAFPASWKKRLLGIAAGFVAIQVINIIRIAALAYAGVHFRHFFEYIHIYVAQGIMIAVSLAIFFVYIHYAQGRHAETA
jgi:exosortase H (IPTLxxWG-CTERM-specific)